MYLKSVQQVVRKCIQISKNTIIFYQPWFLADPKFQQTNPMDIVLTLEHVAKDVHDQWPQF